MADDESDPIINSYEIFIKPHISEDRQIYVFQFPNRDSKQNYAQSNNARPSTMRMKHNSGMVEIDVPMDAWRNYDREKGYKWGRSLQKSNVAKAGGSHGLPGGFGIGGATAGARGRRAADDGEEDVLVKDYGLAVQQGEVLTKQTLGGQYVSDDATTPRYMIGAFRQNQLHLTPVDQVVQMRPQFHHIDARAEQERSSRARENNAGAPPPQARAIHMMVKTKNDGEETIVDTMGDRIAYAQAEKWKHHQYVDEEDHEAWEFFEENLFVAAEDKIKDTEELKVKLPVLESSLANMEFMDAISAPTDPARLSRSKKTKKTRDTKGKGKATVNELGMAADEPSSGLSDPPTSEDEREI